MNLESTIKDVISQKLEDGTVEKLVAEHFEQGIVNALENLFRSYGDVTKAIEEKVKSVMVPYLEKYDYSEYLVKLDHVLVDVLKHTALENKKLLENFKDLMIPDENREIKATELYEKFAKYVANNVDTSELEVNYDDGVSYEDVNVTLEFEELNERSSGSFEYGMVHLTCEEDDDLNVSIPVSRFKYSSNKENHWDIDYKTVADLNSLRHLNDFEVFLMRLKQNFAKLILDETYIDDYIEPEKEPKAYFE